MEGNGPAEELGAVVERFSCQAEAHVQSKCFWFCVERSDEAGRRRLAALGPWLRVTARCGVLQRRLRPTVRHWLPLNESRNIRAAVHRRNPPRHLRGQRSTGESSRTNGLRSSPDTQPDRQHTGQDNSSQSDDWKFSVIGCFVSSSWSFIGYQEERSFYSFNYKLVL